MTEPVIERIAEVIKQRLEQSADGLLEVVRVNRKGDNISPKEGMWYMRHDGSTRNDALSHPGHPPAIAFDATFSVSAFIRDETETSIYETRVNRTVATIAKAITQPEVSPSTWYQMDGLAIIASIGDAEPMTSDSGEYAGVTVPILVTYRVSEDDYTEVRA